MNRRYLAAIALLIALPLFAAPLVSPVPDYDPHLKLVASDKPVQPSENVTTVRYQNLSPKAQRLFDKADKNINIGPNPGYGIGIGGDGPTVPLDEAPEPWSTLAPNHSLESPPTGIHVAKNGQYYYVDLFRFTPRPTLQAVMLRLGPFIAAIGLGTVAGYFTLTAEG